MSLLQENGIMPDGKASHNFETFYSAVGFWREQIGTKGIAKRDDVNCTLAKIVRLVASNFRGLGTRQ